MDRCGHFQELKSQLGQGRDLPDAGQILSRESAFGAPVPVKGDLGAVGGGIPVVAFWTRDVGKSDRPRQKQSRLHFRFPVRTTTNGEVEAGVKIAANTAIFEAR